MVDIASVRWFVDLREDDIVRELVSGFESAHFECLLNGLVMIPPFVGFYAGSIAVLCSKWAYLDGSECMSAMPCRLTVVGPIRLPRDKANLIVGLRNTIDVNSL